MKGKKFSAGWGRSKQPRKQRKYRRNSPAHIKNRFVSVHFSKELRKKHNKRSITARKGDRVKILRGQFRGKTGVIERVDMIRIKVYVSGAEVIKKDGSKALYPIDPSNIMITECKMDDKMRKKSLER